MHDYGGFIMALKLLIPYIPKFEIVKVPPTISSSFNAFFLALSAKSLISAEIVFKPFKFAFLAIGVISPDPVSTATETSQFLNLLM